MNKKGSISGVQRALKTVANIFSWTALTILIIIAGCLIYYVITSNIYASRGEKFEPPFSLYTIISPSMEPNIKVYDVIVDVRVTDPKTIKKGDIITFISSSSISSGFTVTHRVNEVIEDENGISFKTKGDNNLTPDSSLVTSDKVLGKVAFKIPQLGRVQFLLASKGGWICLILIPALGIIAYDILKLFKLIKVKNKVETAVDSDKIIISEEQIEKEKTRKKELKEKLKVPLKEKETKIEEESKQEETNEELIFFVPEKAESEVLDAKSETETNTSLSEETQEALNELALEALENSTMKEKNTEEVITLEEPKQEETNEELIFFIPDFQSEEKEVVETDKSFEEMDLPKEVDPSEEIELPKIAELPEDMELPKVKK